jgi:carbonic anhydrase
MPNFQEFSFKAQPGFNEAEFLKIFPSAIPLRTLVIHCFDPRAAEIPESCR